MEETNKAVTGARKAERVDMSVYVDLENARKAITAAAVELVRGDEYAARMVLIDWLAEDRGERIPVKVS